MALLAALDVGVQLLVLSTGPAVFLQVLGGQRVALGLEVVGHLVVHVEQAQIEQGPALPGRQLQRLLVGLLGLLVLLGAAQGVAQIEIDLGPMRRLGQGDAELLGRGVVVVGPGVEHAQIVVGFGQAGLQLDRLLELGDGRAHVVLGQVDEAQPVVHLGVLLIDALGLRQDALGQLVLAAPVVGHGQVDHGRHVALVQPQHPLGLIGGRSHPIHGQQHVAQLVAQAQVLGRLAHRGRHHLLGALSLAAAQQQVGQVDDRGQVGRVDL